MDHKSRVIILVDMDCFYCQVEENLNPDLAGKPIAVVQYNQWKGGGIIAVNYPAREKGVTRHMRGSEAKVKCPEIKLVNVPSQRGKADLTKYREAGKKVAEVLQTFTVLLERASVDEAYLDITDAVNKRIQSQYVPDVSKLSNTHVVSCNKDDFVNNVKMNLDEGDLKLCVGGMIAEEIRATIYKKTGYKCSAGIAHNKILAKLSCGLHKPNQQTILPQCGVEELYKNLPIRKIKGLGGKFGEVLGEDLGILTMADLKAFSEKDLIQRYDEKTGSWLYNIARGIDTDPVTIKLISKSIGCCKKFPGPTALTTFHDVSHWINELSEELAERLATDIEENNRKAKQIVVSFANEINKKDIHSSRTHPLNSYESQKISADTLNVINKNCQHEDGSYCIKFLGISAGKFEEKKKIYDLQRFFSNESSKIPNTCSTLKEKSQNIVDFTINNVIRTPVLNRSIKENSLSGVVDGVDEGMSCANHEEKTNNIHYNDVYFNVTPVMEVDKNNIIFNKIYNTPESDFKKIMQSSLRSDESNDSIKEEVTFEKEPIEKSSYFTKYFNDIVTPKATNIRNFDTSKNLEESFDLLYEKISENKTKFIKRNQEESNIFPLETITNITEGNMQKDFIDSNKQSCPECRKQLSSSEMSSHLDYHFALKIVKDEAHLYKENKCDIVPKTINTKKKVDKKPQNKGNKRKPETHCNKLTLFLASRQEKLEGPTEKCPECNKKVSASSIMDHLDYHAAKELHMKLNSATSKISPKTISNKIKNKAAILSYFNRN